MQSMVSLESPVIRWCIQISGIHANKWRLHQYEILSSFQRIKAIGVKLNERFLMIFTGISRISAPLNFRWKNREQLLDVEQMKLWSIAYSLHPHTSHLQPFSYDCHKYSLFPDKYPITWTQVDVSVFPWTFWFVNCPNQTVRESSDTTLCERFKWKRKIWKIYRVFENVEIKLESFIHVHWYAIFF